PDLPFDFGLAGPPELRLVLPILFADGFPHKFAGLRIKAHDSRVRLPAHHDDQNVAFHDRRTSHTEKRRWNRPDGCCVMLPNESTGFDIKAHEFSLSAKRVTTVSGQ